ncbi:putative allantoate permease of the major facilitator superfamily [Scheffersomyces xylosifermentans]|uniref:putative allantoate permease of the major facilitator superfamily n=1 Tax=Scheffersomyces xylosifermentans TaxID=1304137 RepID=UPI00315CA196
MGKVDEDSTGLLVKTVEDNTKTTVKEIREKDADVTLKLIEEWGDSVPDFTGEQAKLLSRKLWLTVVPILFTVNLMLFMDKNAMGYATLLGLFEDGHLTQERYNNLQTFFYVGYLVGQVPSHLVFQRIRMSHYITGVTFIWSFLIFIQLAAYNYTALAIIRVLLGITESGVTASIQHTLAMFFTPAEQAPIIQIWWISCLAVGIPGGLIAYGVQFVNGVSPWKVYWSIIGVLTFALSVWSFFCYPDNPATFKLLSVHERVHVIRKVKAATHSSIEQKVLKKYQIVESLKDPVSWLFALHVFLLMLSNNIQFQQNIIFQDLGLTNLQSTIVSIVGAAFSSILAIVGYILLVIFEQQSAHVSSIFCLVSLLGGILAVSLPWSNKIGILAGIFLTNGTGITYIGGLSWSQSSAAGYTKRLSRTVLWFLAYSIVNLFASQIWRSKDSPRFYPAWLIIIIGSWVISPLALEAIRLILWRRNKKRILWIQEVKEGNAEDVIGVVDEIDDSGIVEKREVDVSMLDLTDLENKRFIYPL